MLEILTLILAIALGGVSYGYWRLRQSSVIQQARFVAAETEYARRLADKDTQIEQAKTDNDDQDKTISRLKTDLAQARNALAEQQATCVTLQAKISERDSELAAMGQKLADQMAVYEARLAEAHQQAQADQQNTQQTIATLRTQHLQDRALADSAYDALIVIDEHMQVLAMNAAAANLFPHEGADGDDRRKRLRLVELTKAPALEMMVEDTLANAEEVLEEQMNLHDRSYRVRVQVYHEQGMTLLGMVLQDITQLIRLNRARRDMVANISHELRTPIANIRLIIDGLFHDQDKPKRKESISSLRTIARETDALLWLVQEMADLSMIESGQAIVRMVDVPLIEVIHDATERLANQISAKNLRVAKHIPDKIHVLCDRDLTQRVVVNLLHNAMKWSPSDEVITVSAVVDGDEVVVSVFDNGPGVPDAQVDRIFERFYQVDASRSGHEGTGLGLAICKHIVVAHGGRIWAEGNGQGAGGRFKFTLLSADNTIETPAYYANGSVGV